MGGGAAMLFYAYGFIFAFLPAVLVGYGILQRVAPIFVVPFLLAASLVFYGWWRPDYLVLIATSITINYGFGLAIASGAVWRGRKRIAPDRWLLGLGVAFNLGLLGYFKYAGFLATTLGNASGIEMNVGTVVLPLAISFFTFQQIAYLVDVARQQAAPHGFLEYALFVSFFPQLIAGPIVHQAEMLPQFRAGRGRPLQARFLAVGLTIFAIGLFKKLVLADGMAEFANPGFDAARDGAVLSAASAWVSALAYSFQIYFDFSGYCDMAIGLAFMFGIRLPLNFHSPYKAISVVDFWRRWHMTLSRFLRDYLYLPLGGNRKGPSRRYINLMIVMVLGGLWHGAAWTFVLWGALHGVYLLVNHGWRAATQRWNPGAAALPRPASMALTFLAVTLAWVLFRAEGVDAAMAMFRSMVGWGVETPGAPVFAASAWAWITLGLAAVWLMPNTQQIMHPADAVLDPVAPPETGWFRRMVWRPTPAWALGAGVLFVWGSLAHWAIDRTPDFIYFNF